MKFLFNLNNTQHTGPKKIIKIFRDSDRNQSLLIRNLRGNWSLRLLYEYVHRNIKDGPFGFLDLSFREVFPPVKSAPILFNSKLREKIKSRLFFKNPLPDRIIEEICKNSLKHNHARYTLSDVILTCKILTKSNSEKLLNFSENNIPIGRFVHTCLISKYGIRHFKVGKIFFLRNFILIIRFINSFNLISALIQNHNYSKIILINGRDVVGSAAHLVAFLHSIEVVSLENGLTKSGIPKFSLWNGNMHHWRVKQYYASKIIKSSNHKLMNFEQSKLFLQNNYGLKAKWWHKTRFDPIPETLLREKYLCFFLASETEHTNSPINSNNICEKNYYDEFDQTEILTFWYEVFRKLDFYLVVRLHPYAKLTSQSKRYDRYFLNLCKKWEKTIVISSQEKINSYELASHAKCNFVYRSSIGPELSSRNKPVYYMAPQSWTIGNPNKLLIQPEDFIDLIKNPNFYIEEFTKPIYTDVITYGNYLKFHSSNFQSLTFELSGFNSENKKLVTYLEGTQLDLPKTKYIKVRN